MCSDIYPYLTGLDVEPPATHIPSERFQELKMRISVIQELFHLGLGRTREQQQSIIKLVLEEPFENLENLRNGHAETKCSSVLWKIIDIVLPMTGSTDSPTDTRIQWNGLDDLEFLRGLPTLVETYPVLMRLREQISKNLAIYVSSQEDSFVQAHLGKIMANVRRLHEEGVKTRMDASCSSRNESLWQTLWSDVRRALRWDPSCVYLFSEFYAG